MKKLLALVVALVLVLPAAALASAANNTFIYGIGGDPGNDINTISTSGRFDLTAERLL